MKEKEHPWSNFLKARVEAMLWMRHERNRSDKQIACDLSMDEKQVYSILKFYENKLMEE